MGGEPFRKCAVCSIKLYNKKKARKLKHNVFLSKFPLDENRCKEWVKAVGDPDLTFVPIEKLHQLRNICSAHFHNNDINKRGNRLRKYAVPTENLLAPPLSDDQLKDFPLHIFERKVEVGGVSIPNVTVTGSQKVPIGNVNKSERHKSTPQAPKETRAQSEAESSSSDEEGCNPALSTWIDASAKESVANIGNVFTPDSPPPRVAVHAVSTENATPSHNTYDGMGLFQIDNQVPDLRSSVDTREPLELEEVRAESEEESSTDEDWIVGNASTEETLPTQNIPHDQGPTDYAEDCVLGTGIDIDAGAETFIKCYTCLDEGVEMKSMECVEQVACTIRSQMLQCHLSTLYADVTGLPRPDPSLGAAICVRCVIRLIDAYIFKLQSIESHAVIKSSAATHNSQSFHISLTNLQASPINEAQKKDVQPSPKLELSGMNVVEIPAPETEQLKKLALVEKNYPRECLDGPRLSLEKPLQCPKQAQKRKLQQELPTRPLKVAPDIGTDTTKVHGPAKKEEPSRTTAHETKLADRYGDNSTSGLSTRIRYSKNPTENLPVAVKLVHRPAKKEEPARTTAHETKLADHYGDNSTSGLSTRMRYSKNPTENLPIAVKLVHRPAKKEEPARTTAHETKLADHYGDNSTSGLSTRMRYSKNPTENLPIAVKLVHRPAKKEEPSRTTAHETKLADHYGDNSTSGLSTRMRYSKNPTENLPIAVKLVRGSNHKKKREQ